MAVSGDITTVQLADDSQLLALFPTLNTYRPGEQTDWSAQRAEGKRAALTAFRVITGRSADRAKAVADTDWEYVISAFSLAVVFSGFIHPGAEEWRDMAVAWEERGELAIRQFQYQYDQDDDGTLSVTEVEDDQRVGEIRLVR